MVNKTTIVALRQQNLELEHYGVKGMKWGVRKERPRSGRVRATKQDPQTQARRKAAFKKVTKGTAVIGGLAVGGVLVSQLVRGKGQNITTMSREDPVRRLRTMLPELFDYNAAVFQDGFEWGSFAPDPVIQRLQQEAFKDSLRQKGSRALNKW